MARVRQRFTFASGPNAGKPADFFVFQQGTAAGNQYFSIADCGLCVSKLFYPSLFMNSASLWDGTAEVFPVEGSTPDRSYLKVDGRSAIAPGYDLQWGDGTHSRSLPGLDPLAYSYKNGPGPNGVTIHETDHFDRCATVSEPSWPPPTKSSCPSFRRTGVRVDRVVVQGSGGTEVTIVDSWRSEDGRAHDLDLHYDELVEKQGPDDPSYAFPWVSPAYSTHSPGDIVRAPAAAPASWLVAGDSGAPDGSALYPQGALTFDPVPDAILFRGPGDPLLRYHRRVPAGGALVITQVFDMASTRAAVGAAASAARHRLALPPALSGVGLAPASFAASKGTRLKLTLSKPAAVAVAVDQKLKGRKVKGRCEPKAKKGKRCTFRVPRAKLSLIGAAGANTFAFRPTGLKSGSYIAIVTARDADGRLSKPVTLKFKIKKRRKGKHH